MRRITRGLLLGAVAGAFATSAFAADVETVVVTAQKREQNLQEVPVVVTAVGAQLVHDAGVKDIKDLSILVPGFTVTSTSSEASTTARIRGIGTVGDNPGLESSVGVIIDGVYRPRNSVGFGDLGEVQRIEVLKGPQGTLFGQNTSAGVINVISKLPELDTFFVDGEASYGNHNAWGVSATLNAPVGEHSAIRLFAAKRNREGYLDIITGGGPRSENHDNDQDYYTVRGQWLFKPSEDLTFRLIGDYTSRDEQCCAAVTFSRTDPVAHTTLRGDFVAAQVNNVAAGGIGLSPTVHPFDRVAYANRDNDQIIKDGGGSLQVDWDTGWGAQLTSITALRDWKDRRGSDVDYGAADLLYFNNNGRNMARFRQFSEELRLAGDWEAGTWLLGGVYTDEKSDFGTALLVGNLSNNGVLAGQGVTQYEEFLARRFLGATSFNNFATAHAIPLPGPIFTANGGGWDDHHQKDKSTGVFASFTFNLTDDLEFDGGMRWNQVKKEVDQHYRNLAGTVGCSWARANRVAVGTAIAGLPVNPGESNATRSATFFGTVCSTGGDPAFNNVVNHQEKNENTLTGTAKMLWHINAGSMAYVSWARGYKAGGFNFDRERTAPISIAVNSFFDPDTTFAPEIVNAWEVGSKTTWLDGSLLLNVAAFRQSYSNFQLNTFTGTQFVVTSIPRVTSRGVDFDLLWFDPLPGLTLQGGVTYALTQYSNFVPATAPGTNANQPGSRISFGPMWSTTMSATYEFPVGDNYTVHMNLAGKYSSQYNTGSDLNPQKIQRGFTVVNGRIGLSPNDEQWSVEVWGANIFDQDILQVGFDAPAQSNNINGFLAAPQTFGITLSGHY